MPRDHGRVLCRIWTDPKFLARSESAQRMYMLLLSQPTVNNAGVQPLLVGKWARKGPTGDEDDVRKSLTELEEHGYIVTDTDTEELLIRSFIRNDGGMKHRYIMKNALGCAEAIESALLRRVLARELRRLGRDDAGETATKMEAALADFEPIENPSESHSNGILNPSESHSEPIEMASQQEMPFESHSDGNRITAVKVKVSSKGSVSNYLSSKDSKDRSSAPQTSSYSAAFESFWTAYPRKSAKRKAFDAWKRAVRRTGDNEILIAGATRYREDPNREDQFTKQGEAWLNGDCWDDDPLPARHQQHGASRPDPTERGRSVADIAQKIRAQQGATP
ncbi:hypothetical protein [Rhodococcoides fascians]|uniref:hypothetical protein n=1 Tax=Rhodococcoides fascians TaxID=1828 RepID=UPI00056520EA|nr:hypothetical protein [Rhodococcus fascians]